jgi:hypothetical protein
MTRRRVQEPATRRSPWIFGPLPDLVIALTWVPVFVAWHLLAAGPSAGAARAAAEGVTLALLVSFLHQPLTFGLVYGDRWQFALHRRLFVWAPVAAAALSVTAAVAGLWLVVPMAALWNLQHTLQQRYGVLRIYAGRSGRGSPRLDRAFCYLPMASVLLAVAASPALVHLVRRSGIDPGNARGIELLTVLRPAALGLLVVSVAATLGVLVAVVGRERRAGAKADPVRWLYQCSSLALLASIVVDPTAGFIAYVSAHAVEYAVIVDRTALRRYGAGDARPSLLAGVARAPAGRVGYFLAIVLAALALKVTLHGTAMNSVLYTVGAVHFTYDAVIWKLRRPALARDFRLAGSPEPVPA